jgi:hypothetical protein
MAVTADQSQRAVEEDGEAIMLPFLTLKGEG